MSDGQINRLPNERTVAIAGWVLSLVALVSTAVWCVATIKNTTSSLQLEIQHLASEIGRIGDWKEVTTQKLTDHEIRVRMLEKANDPSALK